MNVPVRKPPEGWSASAIETLLAPLGDGRVLHQGWSPQCEKAPSPSDEKWGVLKTTAIQPGAFCPEHNKLLPANLSPRPQLEVKEGDLLITCAGPRARCGVACLVKNTRPRLMISGKMYRFRPLKDQIEPRYLEAFLQTLEAQASIEKMKTGTSDSGLNLTHDRFRLLMVPLAPREDQDRIVEEIEKQLTRLDAGVAALKRVQANLKRYRAAVLKAACEGRLVPTEAELARREDRAYEPAAVLLGHVGTQMAKPAAAPGVNASARRGRRQRDAVATLLPDLPPLPEGWVWTTLATLLREPLRNGHSAKASGTKDGVRVFTLSAVTEGDFSERNTKITSASRERVEDLWAKPGDLFIERSNTPDLVGLARLYSGPAHYAVFPDLLIRIRVTNAILPRFLEVALLSERGRTFFRARAKGIAGSMPKIDQGTIEGAPVPLPPPAEQYRIVAEVERRHSIADALEHVIAASLHRAMSLRQSVLGAAFSGRISSSENHLALHEPARGADISASDSMKPAEGG